uniref:PH domain leucine-rich repeat protein phosphatase 1 n=1 Tax=Talaromyces marneffei PM1 TaxID=1077442 RepID=A0A093XC39_TALMA
MSVWFDSSTRGTAHIVSQHMIRTRGKATEIHTERTIPWAGFAQQTLGHKGRNSRGVLECFWPLHWPWLGKEDLEKWQNITNFSAMKMLKLDVECFAMVSSEHLAGKCYFPSLKELDIYLGPAQNNRRFYSNRVKAINSFMLNLPALSDLRVTGWHPRIAVDTILATHGSRLVHLSLISFNGKTLSLENLHQLVETCQILETLTIQIKRSRGNYEEYVHYQTLGLLPRLRHLNFKLDAYQSLNYDEMNEEDLQPPSDPSFSEFDERLSSVRIIPRRIARNGHIRDTFINSTLDKELAHNIYQAIYSLRCEGDSRFVPLASMEIGVTGACQFGQHPYNQTPPCIKDVVDYLGRPCYVKRVIEVVETSRS